MLLKEKYPLKIYNSLSKAKEAFQPIHKEHVGMYVCGPTVYSNVHLGNVRTFISFDLVFRYLKYLGYKVRYVRNITDVGHLENDADSGEDRVAKKARLEKLEPMEVAQRYTVDFRTVLQKFNTLPPSIEPTATGHIMEQIAIAEQLVEKGLAYEVAGSVYFDVFAYQKQGDYGILSGRKIADAIHHTRSLDGQSEKKKPQDFALWKKATPAHIMQWDSPWGRGFPGWHLECTAMSIKYLGKKFDIHGGGMDLKFPHHECEIAQGTACNGNNPANYWMHANMLTLNGEKMAKSTGNNITPKQIMTGDSPHIDKAFDPNVVRFFILQAHYRGILDFSAKALNAAEKGFEKLMTALDTLSILIEKAPKKTLETWSVAHWIDRCHQAMSDDFNSPILIAELFDAVKIIGQISGEKQSLSKASLVQLKTSLESFIFDVLGLTPLQKNKAVLGKTYELVELLIGVRKAARTCKKWGLADYIRKELETLGITLKDYKDGTDFEIE